ncbi:MAG: hypothetical protein FJ284_13430, partial [Planctomycetes bacterium]|nr:hypothetical protein [Planctomycetota bacterium]
MTRLQSLELFGFKSFADRTRFEFPAGVTAVVGPNGSGKSNVVDAIKWVLGEQSARSLRGKEMTDVIFSGSTARKPLNMAEVSLIFDNRDRELPVSADEVQIMRRVYRSGESEYLLNGEPSRLKDIREVFSGTGAGTEAYGVIEQGRVDALLTASGRDRRAVFEEAAGITRFRTRRAEAIRRLERAEQNRQRLADIVGEVSTRLDTVRNQAARARRWRSMTDRLRQLRIVAATRDLAGVDVTIAEIERTLTADRATLAEAEGLAGVAGGELTALAASAEAMQAAISGLRTVAAQASQQAAAADATLQWQRSRRGELGDERTRLAEARDRASRDVATLAEEAATAAQAVAITTAAVHNGDARLVGCEQQVAGSGDDAVAARADVAAAAVDCDALRERRLRSEAAAEAAESRFTQATTAVESARDKAQLVADRRARLGEARAAAEGHLQSLQARLAYSHREVEAAESAHRDGTARLQDAWRQLADGRAAAEACRERRDVLRDLVVRQDGLSDAARRLLDVPHTLPGLTGVLADGLVVPTTWAGLVDVALGRCGESLLVDSLEDAIRWHAATARATGTSDASGTAGRIGLIATAALREPDDFEPASDHGVVGRLDRLVLEDAETAVSDVALVRRLLGRAWLVESIERAAPLLSLAPVGTLFLTATGDCLSATAGLEIGAAVTASGLVARRSELRDLEQRVWTSTEAVDVAMAKVATGEADLVRLGDELAAARGRRQQSADALADARAELDRVGRDERAAEDAIELAKVAVHDAERHAIAADATARTARDSVAEATATLQAGEAELARRRAVVDGLERSRSEIAEELQRLRIDLAAQREKLTRYRDEAERMAERIAARQDDVATMEAAVREAAERIRSWELELLAASAARAGLAWEAQQAADALAHTENEASRTEARRQALTRHRDVLRDEAAALSERIHTRELEVGDARHQRARIVERIRDDYDLDI